ncbi:hypothetical protein PspLS_02558, partial [Pyricularia sp. CBS 133598]
EIHPQPADRTVLLVSKQPFPCSQQASSSRDLPDPSSGVRALIHSPLLTGSRGETHIKNPTATLWWESGLGIRSGPGPPVLPGFHVPVPGPSL